MPIEYVDKLKAVMRKRKVNIKTLAENTNQSVQNLSNKMRRGNFTEKEMKEHAEALNCDFAVRFHLRDTGEII